MSTDDKRYTKEAIKRIKEMHTCDVQEKKDMKFTSYVRATLRTPILEKGVMLVVLFYQCNGT